MTAICAYCLRQIRVRRDGNIQTHNRWLNNSPTRCSGSGRPPKGGEPDETPEERLARHKAEFIKTMRELLPPEDLRDIAAAARKAHREDFPEHFPDNLAALGQVEQP